MAATLGRRAVVATRSFVGCMAPMCRGYSVEAYPYVGNPEGFKQVDANTVEVSPPPQNMPYAILKNGNGAKLPMIGMGTFTGTRNTAKAQAGTMYETTKMWIRVGGRYIDAASNYLNEDEIGDAIADCIAEGIVTREELFVSTKLNNPYHREEHVEPMLRKSLLDLKLDYVDMFLMHWPTAFVYVPYDGSKRGFPESYEPDCCSEVTGIQWDAEAFTKSWPPPHLDMGVTIHETWNAMAKTKDLGLTKNVGVCNFKVTLLHELACGTDVKPAIVQNECHPYNQQTQLLNYCNMNGIQFQGYSPLGYGEFVKPDEVKVLGHPLLHKIGEKHGKSTAAVVIRWHIQRGVSIPPFSLYENELRENLKVGEWSLDDEDMEQISTLDKEYHYLRPESWYGLPLWS